MQGCISSVKLELELDSLITGNILISGYVTAFQTAVKPPTFWYLIWQIS